MKRFIIQIGIILFLVIILPLAVLLMKQKSNLSENEEIVQQAFEQQLETILYSINQDSENIIYAWINQIDLPVALTGSVMHNLTTRLLQNNPAIHQIKFFSIDTPGQVSTYSLGKTALLDRPSRQMIQKLEKFAAQNYQRVESIRNGDFTQLYFVLKSGEKKVLTGISVHTRSFVEQNLNPGIQKISKDRFVISVVDTVNQCIDLTADTTAVCGIVKHAKDLWYFPGYRVSISLLSATIKELVEARSKNDKYILGALIGVVLLGFLFVIVSIRKEIRLAEMKSEFVSNVSHEIRTPLALITMYAETLLLNRVRTEEKKKDYLQIIFHETNRLTGIVNHILSFSKMEKNKRAYHFSEFEMNALVKEVCANFQPHFKTNNIVCSLKLSKSNTTLQADQEAIVESLINLLDNAVKYSKPHNKKIEIRTRWDNGALVVDVEDNGIGISPRHQKQVFDKFFRVTQKNLAHKAKGSGLGLNIVQQIMKQHNGRIKVKSTPGEGSCFSLIFPENRKKNG